MTAIDLVDQLTEHKTLGAAPREELAWLASHGAVRHLNEGDVPVRTRFVARRASTAFPALDGPADVAA